MNVLDIIIAIPLVYGAWRGFSKGLLYEIAMIIGLIVGVYLAFKFSDIVYGWLQPLISEEGNLLHILSFLIVLGAVLLIFIFYAKLMDAVLKISSLSIINKLAGGLFGLLKLALVLSMIFWLLKPFEKTLDLIPESARKGSILYEPILNTGKFIAPAIDDVKDEFNEKLG